MKKFIRIFYGAASAALMLFSAVFFSGCGTEPMMLTYDNRQMELKEFSENEQTEEASLLGDSACVISKSRANDEDSSLTAGASMLICLDKEEKNSPAGEKVFASNVFDRLYPASVTKIVTAYVALKYGNLSDEVTIGKSVLNIEDPQAKKCGFNEGDVISLSTLLNSFLVYSGNDAGIAIAEHISGSVDDFADLMNKEVRLLGGTGSHFVNPHGLHDDDHYTTCYDIYLVFKELVKEDAFLEMAGQGSYTANYKDAEGNSKSAVFTSTNRYLTGAVSIPEGAEVFGGKTGTTDEAGSCLILYFNKDGKNYLGFIFHAQDGDDCYRQMTHLIEDVAGAD